MNYRSNFRLAGSIVALSLMAACATTKDFGTAPIEVSNFGVMTNLRNETLYTYDKDVTGSGKSTCNDGCTATWIPLLVGPQDVPGGDFSTIARDDNAKQWAFKGKPVYLFSGDKTEQDIRGDKVAGLWHVLRYPYFVGAGE